MVGIYKITNPKGRVYIGQAIDTVKRLLQYSTLNNCKNQTRLYNSLVKYSSKGHAFETIEECTIEQLNERERYWQDYYEVLTLKGLNCKLTRTGDKSGGNSDEIKNRISETKKKNPQVYTEERRKKISVSSTGRKHSEVTKKKLSEINKNRSKEIINRISQANRGRKLTKEHKQKLSEAKKGKKPSSEIVEKRRASMIGINAVRIRCKTDGQEFSSIKEATEHYGFKWRAYIEDACAGRRKTVRGLEFEKIT